MNELVSIQEAAKKLSVKVSWLRNAVFKKEIKFVKLGRLIRFRQIDLEELIQNNLKKESRGGL